MTDETKAFITMKVNRGTETETWTGWLTSGSTSVPEQKTLSLVGTPTFPEQYAKDLEIIEKDDHWRIELKRFMRDDFPEVKSLMLQYGGQYFGKDQPEKAHFKIPKVTEE